MITIREQVQEFFNSLQRSLINQSIINPRTKEITFSREKINTLTNIFRVNITSFFLNRELYDDIKEKKVRLEISKQVLEKLIQQLIKQLAMSPNYSRFVNKSNVILHESFTAKIL